MNYERDRFLRDIRTCQRCDKRTRVFVYQQLGLRIWTCNKCDKCIHMEAVEIGADEPLSQVRDGWTPRRRRREYRIESRTARETPLCELAGGDESFTAWAQRLIAGKRRSRFQAAMESASTKEARVVG